MNELAGEEGIEIIRKGLLQCPMSQIQKCASHAGILWNFGDFLLIQKSIDANPVGLFIFPPKIILRSNLD